MRALVLYYSYTGNTQKVAEALARELGAELGEITCAAYLRWYGPMAMVWDIFTRSHPRIDTLVPPDSHYDLIVVGGPVWAARVAPPVLSYLHAHAHDRSCFGLFVTSRGTDPRSPPERAIEEMRRLAKVDVMKTEIFRQADMRSGTYLQKVSTFAAALALAVAVP